MKRSRWSAAKWKATGSEAGNASGHHPHRCDRRSAEILSTAYADAPAQSTEWYRRLLATTKTLERLPDRFPIARESSRVFFEVREQLFGRRPNVFRILFAIDGDKVRILRIVRAQRRSPSWRSIEQSYFDE